MKKRILSLILCFCMIFSQMPTGIISAEPASSTVPVPPNVNASGCGCCRIDHTDYDSIALALAADHPGESATNPTTIVLNANWQENVTIPGDDPATEEINEARYITLDLNGYELKVTGSGSVITNNGALTLEDNSTAKTGKITGGKGTQFGGAFSKTSYGGGVYNSGTFIMTGGTITGNSAESTIGIQRLGYGGGVYNKTGATFNMTGGTIKYNTAQTNGGGVYNEGTMTVGGTAEITGNTTQADNTTQSDGGGVYNKTGATFNMTGGTIKDNTALINGGGIYNEGIMTVDGTAKISGNIAQTNGGGVYNAGTMTVGGTAEITGNTTQADNTTQSDGGGVYNKTGATFNMTGGTIKDNTALTNGGGVYNAGTMTAGGTAEITGNMLASGIANNLYLPTNVTVTIDTGNVVEMDIHVSIQTAPTVEDPIAVTGTNTANYTSYFTSDSVNYTVTEDSNHIVKLEVLSEAAKIKETEAIFTTVQAAIDAAAENKQTVQLLRDVAENVEVGGNQKIILDLNGYVLSGQENKAVIYIGQDSNGVEQIYGELTVKDSSTDTRTHYFKVDSNGLWVLTNETAGAKAFEELADRPSAGDIISVTGGCITGGKNGDDSRGGVTNWGTFNFESGNIVGNTGYPSGGIWSQKEANISGGNIMGNTANNGGGIYSNGDLTISAGKILYNTAEENGGGVYTDFGNLYVSGGTISGNEAASGGGVYSSITMTVGGTANITGNTDDSGEACNVYLAKDVGWKQQTMTIGTGTGEGSKCVAVPAAGMNVGVTTETVPTADAPVQFTTNGKKTDEAYFFSDSLSYADKFNDKGTKDDTSDDYLELAVACAVTEDTCTNGSVSVGNQKSAYQGETVTVTATPSDGYGLDAVKITKTDGGEDITTTVGYDSTTGEFAMPAYAVTVSATFKVLHTHSWSYKTSKSSEGMEYDDTIEATCYNTGCEAEDTSLTIQAQASDTLTYDGNSHDASFKDSPSTFCGGDLPAISYQYKATKDGDYAGTSETKNAGYYKASFTVGEGSGAKTASVEYEVAKKQLTITGTAVNGKTYDGTDSAKDQTTVGSLTNKIDSDDVTVSVSSATYSDENAGENKTVTVVYEITGDDAGNYNKPEDAKITAKISAKSINVTAENKSSYVGSELAALTYTADALCSGDQFIGVLSTTANKDAVGKSDITQGTLNVNDGNSGNNYAINYTKGTYTVTAKVIQTLKFNGVTDSKVSKTYGDAAFTETVSGAQTTVTYSSSDTSVATVNASTGEVTILKAGSTVITATAEETYQYAAGSAQYTLTVKKATTSVKTKPTASAITYEQSLSGSSLTNGLGSVAGSFAWTNGATKPAVSDSNKTEYEVTFTPTDTTNYEQTTCKVKVQVNKADTSVTTKPTAAAITYGQSLSNSNLNNGTGSVAGKFTWKDGTIKPLVSDSDKTEYEVTFTPTDTTNYNPTTCKIKVTVNRAESIVKTAPTAKTLLGYSGNEQELITAGETDHGTMYYAFGKDDTTAPAKDWSIAIPKGTDAKTYYVWYKVVGDANHKDSEPKCVNVEISKRQVTVKADDQSIKFGEALPTFTANEDGLVGSDRISYAFRTVSVEAAGVYAIVPYGEADQGNYTVTYQSGTLTVQSKQGNAQVVDQDALETVYKKYAAKTGYADKQLDVVLNTDKEVPEADQAKVLEAVGSKKVVLLDADLHLIIKENGVQIDEKDIGDENDVLIPITYSFDFTGKKDIQVHRVHNSVVGELTESKNADGEYVVFNQQAGTVTVYAKKYSTFAIDYNEVTDAAVSTGLTSQSSALPEAGILIGLAVLVGLGWILRRKING